ILSKPISFLDLSARATKSLKNEGKETIGDLASLTFEELSKFGNLGKRSLDEIKSKLAQHGLSLKDEQ
ncbi:MAG: DNA-directed RNA polymerase subunit alpha, partial [Elusimicrobiota bacterium]|nr:DNA-directed RNA polymerase subunit alpha [Elusimicrobiota bacterium]